MLSSNAAAAEPAGTETAFSAVRSNPMTDTGQGHLLMLLHQQN